MCPWIGGVWIMLTNLDEPKIYRKRNYDTRRSMITRGLLFLEDILCRIHADIIGIQIHYRLYDLRPMVPFGWWESSLLLLLSMHFLSAIHSKPVSYTLPCLASNSPFLFKLEDRPNVFRFYVDPIPPSIQQTLQPNHQIGITWTK